MQSVKHFQVQILTQSFLMLGHHFWGSVRMFFAPYESSFLGLCKFGNRLCFLWGTGIIYAFSVGKHIHTCRNVIQIKNWGVFLYERIGSLARHDFVTFFSLVFKEDVF